MDGVSTTASTVWDFQLSCLSEEDRKYTYEIPYCQYMCVCRNIISTFELSD